MARFKIGTPDHFTAHGQVPAFPGRPGFAIAPADSANWGAVDLSGAAGLTDDRGYVLMCENPAASSLWVLLRVTTDAAAPAAAAEDARAHFVPAGQTRPLTWFPGQEIHFRVG